MWLWDYGRNLYSEIISGNNYLLEDNDRKIIQYLIITTIGYVHNEKVEVACNLTMPFGKYKDYLLGDIPIKYLDRTIAQMPNSFIKRKSDLIVDHCVDVCSRYGNKKMSEYLHMSYFEITRQVEAPIWEHVKNQEEV